MPISLGAMGMTPSKHCSSKRPIRAALYARISTLNHGQDPEVQLRELREFCHQRGFTIAQEYVDRGICGSREQRPALDKLIADCRKRIVDAVVVYRYDRFARSLRQLVNALDEFRSLGIDFISIHEGVDTSTPNGRLVFGIFARERNVFPWGELPVDPYRDHRWGFPCCVWSPMRTCHRHYPRSSDGAYSLVPLHRQRPSL